jgi:hypothetical protein
VNVPFALASFFPIVFFNDDRWLEKYLFSPL